MRRFSVGMLTGLLIGLILATTTFAAADNPVRLVVKGRETYSNPAPMMYQDRVFVPVRFVSEALDYDVGWANDTVYIDYKTPEIIGSDEFIKKTESAIELLKKKSYITYQFVTKYINEIKENSESPTDNVNVAGWADEISGICYFYPKINTTPDKEVFYRAMILSHEAFHIMQYEAGFAFINTPDDNEVTAYLFSYRVAKQIGAPVEFTNLHKLQTKKYLKL